jgi:hypothetical protein
MASWSYIKFWIGKLANLVGYPGIVRECDYRSNAIGTSVTVKRLELYTLVSVNGLDVYFNRFTGLIDGVGASPASGCIIPDARIHESGHPAEPSAELPPL